MIGHSQRKRLPPEIFHLPVESIRRGVYSDKYFVRTRDILIATEHRPKVLMQVFTRQSGILCGIDEAIAVLRLCSDHPEKLRLHALTDGERIEENETVMTIEGDYASFTHLETVMLGVMARGTSVATAVRDVVDAAQGKPVLFFPARFDHYSVQQADGYAAFIGGVSGVSTDANGILWNSPGIGTIPHGLIAACDGDTVRASEAFDRAVPQEVHRIALVDFDNDCVRTALEVAAALKDRLWGVRLDTASDLWDRSIVSEESEKRGVCPDLVFLVRNALDREGYKRVKIVISGGFNAERIRKFVRLGVPFDSVGVGSALYRNRVDFTADVVQLNGKHCAKVGRAYHPNPKLQEVPMMR